MKPTVNYLSVLKGVNVNHGGRSVSLTAPNGMAHNSLLTNLFQATPGVKANVWEAHGTGTSVGDPIEVRKRIKQRIARLIRYHLYFKTLLFLQQKLHWVTERPQPEHVVFSNFHSP